jgi:hypothetical protein
MEQDGGDVAAAVGNAGAHEEDDDWPTARTWSMAALRRTLVQRGVYSVAATRTLSPVYCSPALKLPCRPTVPGSGKWRDATHNLITPLKQIGEMRMTSTYSDAGWQRRRWR